MKMFLFLSGYFFSETTTLLQYIFSPHYKQNLFGNNKLSIEAGGKKKHSQREMAKELSLG